MYPQLVDWLVFFSILLVLGRLGLLGYCDCNICWFP